MRSVLVYTVHKAASSFLHRLTTGVSQELNIPYFSMNDDSYFDVIRQMSWKKFLEEHKADISVFGPIRSGSAEPTIPDEINHYSIVLHLRDPRDVLTSLYYSHTYSHSRRSGRFNPSEEERDFWEQEGIDKFVIQKSSDFKSRYQTLVSNLLDRPNVKFLKYEDMVSDYGKWLEGYLSAFSHITPPSKRFLELIKYKNSLPRIYKKTFNLHKNEFAVETENKYHHKRQVTPGDYQRKLNPDTIESLNTEFKDILVALDYAI